LYEGVEEREVRKHCARTMAVLAFLVALCLCVSTYGVSGLASEPSLTDILNNLGFTNVALSTVETFPPGTYNITIYAEFTPYFNENVLSFYRFGTDNFTTVFSGIQGGYGYFPPVTETFTTDYQFGLSLSRAIGLPFTWFTESSRNPYAIKNAMIYTNVNNPSMFLIGFDDRTICNNTGDLDYNDMVFSLQLQYYLHVVSPYDTPSGQGWYNNGTNAYASLGNSTIDYGNGTRTAFVQWSGDASGTNYQESNAIYMDQNRTAIANWKTQNYLTVRTNPLGIATIPGEGWYDQGQNATLTAPPVSGYAFSYWDEDNISLGYGVNPVTIRMDAPHIATAHYTKAAPPPPPLSVSISPLSATVNIGQAVTFSSTVSGGTKPYTYQWYLDGSPVAGANSIGWTFIAQSEGIHYVYLQVTDALNQTAKSETARIVVTSIPVGGYTEYLPAPDRQTGTPYTLACYTASVILMGTIFQHIKRKRKQ
jgi:hypothetical protein